MAEFTDDQRDTIRDAAFGAIVLVSKADPGFLSTFKESRAGSRAFTSAPEELAEILQGGFPSPLKGDDAEQLRTVTSGLGQAMAILAAKGDGSAEVFKSWILEACQAVANASKGFSVDEHAAINQIRMALG